MQMDFRSLSVRVLFFSSFTKTDFRIILSFTTNEHGKAVDLLELEFTSLSYWLSVVSIEEEL